MTGKPHWVLNQVKAALEKVHQKKPGYTRRDISVACLGIAFKPDIDDLRESPALSIANAVAKLGCRVLIVEPNIESLPTGFEYPNAELISLDQALAEADIACVLVKHKTFIEQAESVAEKDIVIDAVGLLS